MANDLETVDKLERRISLSLPAAEINKEVESRLEKLSRGRRWLAGGPLVVAQRYGHQVQYEVMNDKLGDAFNAAATKTVRVAGAPASPRRIKPRRWNSTPRSRSTRKS